ncbi:MAG: bifunctional phosphoserine phosphatase/homoserine phosphotransferase ThrH [Eggerthella lenta]
MDFRLDILRQHGLGLKEIQETIARIDPCRGRRTSSTSCAPRPRPSSSATRSPSSPSPHGEAGWQALFCNELEVADDGTIAGFRMRCPESKLTTVRALQSCGFDTIAAGDSHNDLGMIRASKAGFLFRSPDSIKAENTDLPAFEEYDDLLAAVKQAMA